jgi:FAD-linked oxidoreductase
MARGWTRRKMLGTGVLGSALLALNPLRAFAEAARKYTWRNWGGNLYSEPALVAAPDSEDELLELLKNSTGTVRPIGSGHSWSGLVPTDGTMITLDGLMGVIEHDPDTLQCEVWAGTKLFLLGPMLEQVGQSLVNMSDVNYQSLGGAIATSTHGTGASMGSMSSYVQGFRLLTPAGEIIDCDADNHPELLRAGINSLGSLGVVSRVRLQNREAHRLHQQEWLTETEEVLEDIEPLIRDNLQFELFPMPHANRSVVVVTNEAAAGAQDIIEDDPYAIMELKDAFETTRKIPGVDDWLYSHALDYAYGEPKHRIGPSYSVLAHPRNVPFIEMEYTVPAELGVQCLRDVLAAIGKNAPDVCFPLEFRYVKGDDSLIGMFSERDGCSISVHQFAEESNWREYLSMVEKIFHKYQGRPHWGKWHSLEAPQLSELYPRWQEFREIRRQLDPQGRMLNPYLRKLLGEKLNAS